jgi:hypothetical protein
MFRPRPPALERASAAGAVLVTWTGDPPAGEDARVIWQTLGQHPGITHDALVERVAETLFRRDLEAFGAAADIGFLRPFYVALARERIAMLDGTLLRVGAPA